MLLEPIHTTTTPLAHLRRHEVFTRLPQLTDKVIVDLVNGLGVTEDHIEEQSRRQARAVRVLDSLTGEGSRRQHAINASLSSQMRVTVQYLKELEISQARSMLAIERVARNVDALAAHTTELGDALVDLEVEVATISRDVEACRRDLQRVDLEQSATREVTAVFDHWDAGHWTGCSALERLFLALDALFWGTFGDCVRAARRATAEQYLKMARDRAAARLRDELEPNTARALPLSLWCQTGRRSDVFAATVGYLAETANARQPLCGVIAAPELSASLRVPRVLSVDRAIERVFDEIFTRRAVA